VRVQDRQETDGDARNRQSVKDGVEKLDVDSSATPTYSIQQNGCKKTITISLLCGAKVRAGNPGGN
jgi:hypothetical protein